MHVLLSLNLQWRHFARLLKLGITSFSFRFQYQSQIYTVVTLCKLKKIQVFQNVAWFVSPVSHLGSHFFPPHKSTQSLTLIYYSRTVFIHIFLPSLVYSFDVKEIKQCFTFTFGSTSFGINVRKFELWKQQQTSYVMQSTPFCTKKS